MEKDPQKHVEEPEQQELDEQQSEEVAGGIDLRDAQLRRLAAAGAGKLPQSQVSAKDLDKLAAGRIDPKYRDRQIH